MLSMPIFRLTDEIVFPPPRLASEGGLLAVGGDLTPARLLSAYENGIFPWYGEGEPILWWSPDPRFVLFPDQLKISRSMRSLLKKNIFTITFDNCFQEVVAACRKARKGRGEGTWITAAMTEAYVRIHKLGLAHSVEVWREGVLAGGLYGVSLGKCFFGESMFSNVPNASKAALVALVKALGRYDFHLIDCQVYTDHLSSLGAEMISRGHFLRLLNTALAEETLRGNWCFLAEGHGASGKDNVLSPVLTTCRRRYSYPYFVNNKSLSS
jgi:leucyl/phenylalanyl-tRNA--protein transferase